MITEKATTFDVVALILSFFVLKDFPFDIF